MCLNNKKDKYILLILFFQHSQDPLCSAFYILWYIFEPLLFGVIGCQIDVYKLELSLVYCGIGIIASGVFVSFYESIRALTAFIRLRFGSGHPSSW